MLELSISSRLDSETEPVTTTANIGAMLRMERCFKLESAVQALQNTKLEHVAWLAWDSRRAAGHTVPTWEVFFNSVVDMNFDVGNDAPLADGEATTS